MADEGNPCYLAALSPELIDNILSHLDSVRTLGSFINTSRFVHRCFDGREETVILRVLRNELGLVLADAMFLRLLPYPGPINTPEGRTARLDNIKNITPIYGKMLGDGGPSAGGGKATAPSFAELVELCRTLHSMNFLASTYFAAQLRSFGGGGDDEGPAAAASSRAERLRVLRAL